MSRIAAITVACVCAFSTITIIHAAEEKTEIKSKKDGSWKMKVKRSGKDYVGVYEGREYHLRGHDFGPTFRDDTEYTVYGTLGDDYVTTTRVEPIVTETVTTTTPAEESWHMRVMRRDNDWVGVVGEKTYVLRGEAPHEEGEFTIHGRMGDGFITTSRHERFKK